MMMDPKGRRLVTIEVSIVTPYCIIQMIERFMMLISKIPHSTVSICDVYLRVNVWILYLEEDLEFNILFLQNCPMRSFNIIYFQDGQKKTTLVMIQ